MRPMKPCTEGCICEHEHIMNVEWSHFISSNPTLTRIYSNLKFFCGADDIFKSNTVIHLTKESWNTIITDTETKRRQTKQCWNLVYLVTLVTTNEMWISVDTEQLSLAPALPRSLVWFAGNIPTDKERIAWMHSSKSHFGDKICQICQKRKCECQM